MANPNDTAPAVLVTGASTGIGAACVLELDKQGFRVFAGVRNEAACQRLQAIASDNLTAVMFDVTDAASIAAAAATVHNAVGEAGLAGLVNNAGITVCGPLEVVPIEALRKQLEVNVIGQVAVTQAVLPLLRAARGRIVNVGSVNGALAPPYFGPYSASKFALEAITDSLRGELRRWGINVSIVEPGPVDTPIWDKSISAADELAKGIPSEKLEPYQADLDALRAKTKEIVKTAMPVQKVVDAVVHALTASRPKTRYFITWKTRLASRIFRLVPDRIRDWILRREMGLS